MRRLDLVMATAFMIPALVDRGAIEEARALLAAADLTGPLGPTWPYNVARHARGCLYAAAGDHPSRSGNCLRPESGRSCGASGTPR